MKDNISFNVGDGSWNQGHYRSPWTVMENILDLSSINLVFLLSGHLSKQINVFRDNLDFHPAYPGNLNLNNFE